MSDTVERLSAALADRYTIQHELGAGGMATVYLAEDRKHDRRVAVKVLRPELAAVLGHERFLREITTTASLRHPHILPLYDSGAVDQFLYYVMPYVEGESLRDRIHRERQLPLDEALNIAREVADALAYAHTRDVVHRDIKPENILLEAGHAVIADFGVARAIGAAGGDALTETGMAVGTPTYMSPEQAGAAGELDGRSDVYSLGCVLYEMLGGQPPFTGPTVESVIHQHMSSDPRSVTEMRPTVPGAVAAAIGRALEKTPADRFSTASEFAAALTSGAASVTTGATAVSRPRSWRSHWTVAAAMGVVAVALIAFLVQRGGETTPFSDGRPMLAVLPFENLGVPDDEYFADGITEEMTSRLAQISGLGVVSRTSAIRYKGVDKSLQDIAHELGVEYVLEGTVRTDRANETGQVRVTPQLIRVLDDTHLWTDRYTASLAPGEVFAVQAEIAEQVAAALNVTLLGSESAAVRHVTTTDAAAHDAYLLGRFHWNKRTTEELQRAAAYFHEAVDRDSTYAEAYTGLADTYSLYGYYAVPDISRREAYTRAEAAARRAIELDSTLAAAHASLGNILAYGAWEWDAADREFQRAIALDPEYPVAQYWYAEMLLITGRLDEAITHAERAVALDPASPVARHILGGALFYSGRAEEAVALERESTELVPTFLFGYLSEATILGIQGKYTEALEAFEAGGFPIAAQIVNAWRDPSKAGELVAAMSTLERETPDSPFAEASVAAFAYMVAGAVDSVFARLEAAYEQRSEAFLYDIRHPLYDPIRSDPRYLSLMRRIGLDP